MKPSNSPILQPTGSNNVRSLLDVFGITRLIVATTLLSWLVTACAGQRLENEKVFAFAGDAVILPCHFPVTHDLPTVEWSKEGLSPNITFLYRDGCETFEMKNSVFQYRTNFIMGELKDGNISLRMSDVRLTDAGKYQCTIIWKRSRHVIKTLELLVCDASEPKLSVVSSSDAAATLQCEANGWFPEPEVTFVDDQGNDISAENPKTTSDRRGCFTVTRRMTVHTPLSRVTCRVHVPHMNKTKETVIHFLPGSSVNCYIIGCTVPVVLVTLGTCALLHFCQKIKATKKCEPASGLSPEFRYTDDPQETQNDNNENAAAELQKRNEELENQVRLLTKEVDQLRSSCRTRPSPVLQHGQSTISKSPSTSSPDMSISCSPQRPPDHKTQPLASTSSNHTKPSKHSEPGVQRQDPAMDFPANERRRNFSDGCDITSASCLPSTSEKKGLCRTKSQSQPIQSVTGRNPISLPPSYVSYNRFSPLENLNEESVRLLL